MADNCSLEIGCGRPLSLLLCYSSLVSECQSLGCFMMYADVRIDE